MDNSSSLINSLSSPGLLVLTSTAEPTRGTNTPCQPAHHFGVQMSMDKPNQMPFLSTAYSLMYHHPERLTAPSRAEYPPQLLSLHPQFAHPSLDCGGVGMMGYGALHPFPPFHLTEDMDCFQAGYLSAKRAKMLTSSDPPQVRYLALEKELEAQRSQISRDIGNGMEGQSSGTGKYRYSPTSRQTGNKRKKKAESPQPLYCPLCQRALQRGELADHLQYEMGTLSAHLSDSEPETPREEELLLVQSPSSGGVAHEGTESPRGSPQVSEEGPKVDRQQSFQQVKSNREARLGARAGRCRRMKGILDDQLAGCLLRVPRLGEAEDELSEGSRCGDDDYRFSRKGLSETKESQLWTPRSTSSRDGDVDMVESDGDEQPPVPPHQFSCPRSSMPLMSEEGQNASFHLEATAKRKEEEHGIAAKTMNMLKAQIQELTQRLLRADEYKCHICLDSYSVPLASIQCWHIHCEQCWLRTLGTKKLCPQCHTITSPADLRRVYL